MKIEPRDEFDDNRGSFMPIVTNVQSLQVKNESPKPKLPSNTSKKSMNSSKHQAQALTPQLEQKVQIVRSVDGKLQVRGLLPGQQLARMPDGKLIIFSKPQPQKQVQHAITQTLPVSIAREEPPTIVAVPLAPGRQAPPGATVFKSGGKTYYLRRAAKPNQEN